jgi:hypothetical protein
MAITDFPGIHPYDDSYNGSVSVFSAFDRFLEEEGGPESSGKWGGCMFGIG